jgi:hypothetical protein
VTRDDVGAVVDIWPPPTGLGHTEAGDEVECEVDDEEEVGKVEEYPLDEVHGARSVWLRVDQSIVSATVAALIKLWRRCGLDRVVPLAFVWMRGKIQGGRHVKQRLRCKGNEREEEKEDRLNKRTVEQQQKQHNKKQKNEVDQQREERL